jgi:hypothetical protein
MKSDFSGIITNFTLGTKDNEKTNGLSENMHVFQGESHLTDDRRYTS